ncbi:hypothetical protein OG21DRAFT_927646 [Imleria badia]|nr:hypothetical protein OG21DRAFT_927646 [Imleria badia]
MGVVRVYVYISKQRLYVRVRKRVHGGIQRCVEQPQALQRIQQQAGGIHEIRAKPTRHAQSHHNAQHHRRHRDVDDEHVHPVARRQLQFIVERDGHERGGTDVRPRRRTVGAHRHAQRGTPVHPGCRRRIGAGRIERGILGVERDGKFDERGSDAAAAARDGKRGVADPAVDILSPAVVGHHV